MDNINHENSDLTFFTNEPGQSLLDRFRSTLKDTKSFDVLVGYFRSSGFYLLYKPLEPVEKIRILVGLNVDRDSYDIMQYHEQLGMIDFESHKRTKKQFQENLKSEIETSDENDNKLEIGIRKFIEFLQSECKNKEIDKSFKFIGVMTAGGAYTLKKATIEYLPIRLITNTHIFEELVDYVIYLKEIYNKLIYNFFDTLIDGLVFELYFPNEFRSANKEILIHLGDLKPITDEMSEEEKLAIIQAAFERLHDPNHPVRQAMDTLDEVEEVRIIR